MESLRLTWVYILPAYYIKYRYLSLPIPTIMKMAPKLKLVNSAPQRIKRPNPEKVAIIVEITPAKPSHG